MTNEDKYNLLAETNQGLASEMAVVPNDLNINLDGELLEKGLKRSKDFALISFKKKESDTIEIPTFDALISYKNDEFEVELYINKVENLYLNEYRLGNKIDDKSLELAQKQPYFLGTSMHFGSDKLDSFHLQLKILNAIVPNASLCVDFMSYNLLSPEWLAMTAKSKTAPSPSYLYTIHGVFDENENGAKQYWFHTHGLLRCGIVELEMVNISQYPEQMNTMLNMTVTRLLSGDTKEKERFMIGYDGMGIDLCWLRWEEALKDFPSDILGGSDERKEEDNIHANPVGVLFAVQEGNMVSPEIYGKTLQDNPIYYISNAETARMSSLAKERFTFFKQVLEDKSAKPEKKSFFGKLFGGAKKTNGESQWRFLVKLGLQTDNPSENGEKEHLWFDVQSIEGNNITGELLNEPYWIAQLKAGNVKTYPIEVLTDWIIYGPESGYTSDTIYELGFK